MPSYRRCFIGLTALWLLLSCGGRADSQAVAPAPVASATSPAPEAPAHPRILLGNAALRERLVQALNQRSQAAMRFQADVSQQIFGRRSYGFQPWYAALMFQLSGDARYAQFAIAETDRQVAAEEARMARGEAALVAADSYLDVGAMVGNVALVYDWCHTLLTPEQRERWLAYAHQAVWNVWNPSRARWGQTAHTWTGWSVDNPSNNYYYSFLRATMLLGLAAQGEHADAQRWLHTFRQAKLRDQLMPTFNRDLVGGGSREGTGYGTAMKNLFQVYDWWQQSTGEPIAYATPHTLASMAHLLHSVVPTLDRIAPTGDHSRDASAAFFDYHREFLLVLMSLFPQEPISGVAQTLLAQGPLPRMQRGFMFYVDFLYEQPGIKARPLDELATTYWASGTGQLMMRSAWAPAATYANFICGPFTESHAHRDQGSFVIFQGQWLAQDANLNSHSGLEQDEEAHNLVRFAQDGSVLRQRRGQACELEALADNAWFTYARANATALYRGQSAIALSERELLFVKPDTFVIFDRAAVTRPGVQRIWSLNLPGPYQVQPDRLRFESGARRLDLFRLAPQDAALSVEDWTQRSTTIRSGVRLELKHEGAAASQFLNVLSTRSGVVSATREDSPGHIGARIQLADGRQAKVSFPLQGHGSRLELIDARGTPQHAGLLPQGIARLDLYAR